jgi:aspartyl protease family protein
MPIQRSPWDRKPPSGRNRVVLALALTAIIAIAIWQLAELFPGGLESDTDRISLVRLLGVLVLVSAGVVFFRRVSLGEVVRNLAIWAGIVAVLAIGFTYQDELRDVVLRVRSELVPGYPVAMGPNVMRLTEAAGGHFHVIGTVNGAPVRFLIDTGASDIVLSPADARRAGIDPRDLSFTRLYQTANGVGRGAPITLRTLAIGPIELANVSVSVNEADMGSSLLGMTFLRTLASVEFRGRELFLRWH